MFEAWNVTKGCKVQGGRILSQGTVNGRSYLKKSDSSSVSCRAISIGWRVIRSNCSIFPGLQMCHSVGGGEFWKVMLWLGTFTWTCFFLCIIFVIDSTHFLIVFPVTQTHYVCVHCSLCMCQCLTVCVTSDWWNKLLQCPQTLRVSLKVIEMMLNPVPAHIQHSVKIPWYQNISCVLIISLHTCKK